MMNEQTPFQDIPSNRPRKRRTLLWLLALPVMLCAACAALSVYALMPLRGKIIERFSGSPIPVTGDENSNPSAPLPDQKSNPGNQAEPSATPGPGANSRPDAPGATYRDALDERLNTCTASFHDLLMLEQVAFDQPDMLSSGSWRSQARDANTAFHDDCQALGTLPDAPAAYKEVDQLLKKAAGEVQPATDDFAALLEASAKGSQNTDKARSAFRHLLNFIRYTQSAEDVLSGMDHMKQI